MGRLKLIRSEPTPDFVMGLFGSTVTASHFGTEDAVAAEHNDRRLMERVVSMANRQQFTMQFGIIMRELGSRGYEMDIETIKERLR